MWNPESTDIESRIHSVESGIQDSLGLPYMGRKDDTIDLALTNKYKFNDYPASLTLLVTQKFETFSALA